MIMNEENMLDALIDVASGDDPYTRAGAVMTREVVPVWNRAAVTLVADGRHDMEHLVEGTLRLVLTMFCAIVVRAAKPGHRGALYDGLTERIVERLKGMRPTVVAEDEP